MGCLVLFLLRFLGTSLTMITAGRELINRVPILEHTSQSELERYHPSFPLSSACTYTISHNSTVLITSIGCFGLGLVLDMKNTSQRRRAQYGMAMVVILNLGVYIWSIVMQSQFQRSSPGKIDWDEDLYARSFLPYFFVQTTGPLSQSYMYWLLSSFATDAQGMPSSLLSEELS